MCRKTDPKKKRQSNRNMGRGKGHRLVLYVLTGALLMAGCGQDKEGAQNRDGTEAQNSERSGSQEKSLNQEGENSKENRENDTGTETGTDRQSAVGRRETAGQNGDITVTAILGEGNEKQIIYTQEDREEDWDEASAGKVILSDEKIAAEGAGVSVSGNVVTIKQAGTYVVSGSMKDGQIRMNADKGETVHLVLNGLELSNETTAPVYGEGKCKVVMTLAEGTKNRIEDKSSYQYPTAGEDEPDAPIFVKGDLTINGTGQLEVRGNYQSGIRSKDNLKVMSGILSVDAKDDGLKGRDSVVIRDGVLNISAVKDGIKSNNDEDPEKGFIWIDGGEIVIEAQDDGIQAETALIVCGGKTDVAESQEGLAGKTVDILGGLVVAVTEDDGINSAASVETEQEKMQNQEGVYTRIAGGEVRLNTRADGIDSNGDLYMEGGGLYLSGPVSRGDGILDYNGTGKITGGTVLAAGTSGMMQTFGEESTQNYLVIYCQEQQKEKTPIRLKDESGQVLGQYAPEKPFDTIIASVPEMEIGSVYRVALGDTGETEIEMEVTGRETVYGTSPGGGHGGGPGGGERRRPGGMPEGEPPEGLEGRRPENISGEEPPEGLERRRPKDMPEGELPEELERKRPEEREQPEDTLKGEN